ncbi:MAG: hypothetical protein AAF721_01035 [Myxococcota bacterium]
MAETRADLLALDTAGLVTLANRGLVNRATKLVERGEGPTLELREDGEVVATSGEIVTRMPVGAALADTQCSCGSTGVCRHRIAAVLAFQRAHEGSEPERPTEVWSPAEFEPSAVVATLGSRAVARAKAQRAKGVVAEVCRVAGTQTVPAVRLSTATVQFLVPHDLAYARCDCAAAPSCEHIALAIWAFAEADRTAKNEPTVVVQLASAATTVGMDPLTSSLALADAIVLEGVVHIGGAAATPFAVALRALESAGFQWPKHAVEALAESLEDYRSRAAMYRPEFAAELVTELHARARAAAANASYPAAAILGQDVAPETRLDHLRLTALGARITGSQDVRTAHVYLAVPDDRMVLVFRKGISVDADNPEKTALATRMALPGIPLGTLARGQVVTAAARRRANRQLHFGRSVVAKTSVTPQLGEWDGLPAPILVDDFAELHEELRTRVPTMLGPRHLADRMRVLAVRSVGKVVYRAAEQRIDCELRDANDNSILVRLEHRAAAPGAVDALAAALAGKVRFVAGEVDTTDGELSVDPVSVVTDRVIAIDLEDTEAQTTAGAGSTASLEADPIRSAFRNATEVLDRGVHTGLLRAPRPWHDALQRAASQLAAVGLAKTAATLRSLHDAVAQLQVAATPEADQRAVARWIDASIRLRVGAGLA